MTDTVAAAVRATFQITLYIDTAREAIAAGRRINSVGVFHQPSGTLAALKLAREELDKAISLHGEVRWPSDRDYVTRNSSAT